MAQEPQAGETWQAPSGVVFTVESVEDGIATVDTHRLADGSPATLKNTQEYSVAEMRDFNGWERQ